MNGTSIKSNIPVDFDYFLHYILHDYIIDPDFLKRVLSHRIFKKSFKLTAGRGPKDGVKN